MAGRTHPIAARPAALSLDYTGGVIVRNYSYDKDFLIDVYPTLIEMGMTQEGILTMYNEFWAAEATERDRVHHHECSYEAYNKDTWKQAATEDKGYKKVCDGYDVSHEDYEVTADDDDSFDESELTESGYTLSFVQSADDVFKLMEDSPLHEIYYTLPDKQQTIVAFLLRRMTQTSIAAQFGISIPAINGHIKRIRKQFMPYCEKNHLLKVKK